MLKRVPRLVEDLPRGPGVRIVREDNVRAWQDGYRFLAKVKRIAAEVEIEAEEIYAVQYERGLADGRKAGQKEAALLVSNTRTQVDQHLASLEEEIGALALEVVERVLGQFDVAELVARAAAHATTEFRQEKWLKICVHPSAVGKVASTLAGSSGGSGPRISVEGDRALSARGCIVASDLAVMDAGIDVQMKAFASALGVDRKEKAG